MGDPRTAPRDGSDIGSASFGLSLAQMFCHAKVRVSAGALPVRCTGRVGRAAATGTAGGVPAKLAAQHRSGRAHRAVGLRRAPLRQGGQRRTRPSVWGKLRSAAGTRTVASPFRRARSEPDPAAPSKLDNLTALQRLNTLSALRQTLRGSRQPRMGHPSSRRERAARCPNASVAGMHEHSKLAAMTPGEYLHKASPNMLGWGRSTCENITHEASDSGPELDDQAHAQA